MKSDHVKMEPLWCLRDLYSENAYFLSNLTLNKFVGLGQIYLYHSPFHTFDDFPKFICSVMLIELTIII